MPGDCSGWKALIDQQTTYHEVNVQRTRILVAGIVLIAAACSSDSSTSSLSATDDVFITSDVANAAADGVSEDVEIMAGMSGDLASPAGAFLEGPGDFRPNLTGCTFAAGTFTCQPMTRNGLTLTRTVTFFDASAHTEAAYDPALTASIHVVSDVAGSPTHGPWSATVARHRDFTFSGLAGTETSRTVNGSGTDTETQSRVAHNDSTRSYTLAGTVTVTNVVMPVRTTDGGNGWPTSGTITRTYSVTPATGPHAGTTVTRTATVTFNGTSTPTVTVNGSNFTIDLGGHTAGPRHP